MTRYKVLLNAVAILSIVGSTLCEEESGCTLTHNGETMHLDDMITEHVHECFGRVGQLKKHTLESMESLSDYKTLFKNYCHRQESIRNCFSRATSYSVKCLNKTEQNTFKYFEDNSNTALAHGCMDDGGHVAMVMFMMHKHAEATPQTRQAVSECITVANTTEPNRDHLGTSSIVLDFYLQTKVFKTCIINKLRGMNQAVFSSELLLNGFLRNMKCPHPGDGSKVLCETLDTTPSTEETFCPFVTKPDEEFDMRRLSIDHGIKCMTTNLNQLDLGSVIHLKTIDEFKTYFNTYCQNRPHIGNCLGDVLTHSKACLNGTEHQDFVTFTAFLKSMLEHGCDQDEEAFANIFHGVINEVESQTQHNVTYCINTASRSFKKNIEHNTTDGQSDPVAALRTYRLTESLKECLIDGVPDDQPLKTVIVKFVDDILKDLKA